MNSSNTPGAEAQEREINLPSPIAKRKAHTEKTKQDAMALEPAADSIST